MGIRNSSIGKPNVVQHAHPNNGWIHFEAKDITESQDFILIDISDSTNYPHSETDCIHLEGLRIHTDADVNATYTLQIGFLEDVDDTNGDFHSVLEVDGVKKSGTAIDKHMTFYPNGPRCKKEFITTSEQALNEEIFRTNSNIASTLDPTLLNTPSGNGDLILRIGITAGSVTVGIEMSYHSSGSI